MDNYYGIFNVEEGTWNMAKTWNSRAHTTVSGGTLNLAKGLILDNLQSTSSDYYCRSAHHHGRHGSDHDPDNPKQCPGYRFK